MFHVNLSRSQQKMLMDHISGAVPIIESVDLRQNHLTRISLVRKGLLAYTWPAGCSRSIRPSLTKLTDKGRKAACSLLGQYADSLTAAGYIVTEPTGNGVLRLGCGRTTVQDAESVAS